MARAMAVEPTLLILDEPAAGLNDNETLELLETIFKIRDNGVTVLLIEHDMDMVMEVTDYLTVINFGKKIAEGTPKEIQKRFRMKAKILFRRGRGMNLRRFIAEYLNPFLRGWFNYYKHCKVKTMAEALDSWIRRRLRLIIWRQWKKPRTRFKRFIVIHFTGEYHYICSLIISE